MRPRPLPSNSRNSCLPSSAVNSLQNTALPHLTSFLSAFSALFSATGALQPFGNQSVPHSFYRHGGVGGRVPLSSQTVFLPPRMASTAAALPLYSHILTNTPPLTPLSAHPYEKHGGAGVDFHSQPANFVTPITSCGA